MAGGRPRLAWTLVGSACVLRSGIPLSAQQAALQTPTPGVSERPVTLGSILALPVSCLHLETGVSTLVLMLKHSGFVLGVFPVKYHQLGS